MSDEIATHTRAYDVKLDYGPVEPQAHETPTPDEMREAVEYGLSLAGFPAVNITIEKNPD